jgi:hypothetical protein
MSETSKNPRIISALNDLQEYHIILINDINYPISCHFVKRPFAHEFSNFYFSNPKAEELKWLTAKFLDLGLFEFWKRLESHMLTSQKRRLSLEDRSKRSNSTSTEALDVHNFVKQVHLTVFYIAIAILTATCVAIFLLECAMQKA